MFVVLLLSACGLVLFRFVFLWRYKSCLWCGWQCKFGLAKLQYQETLHLCCNVAGKFSLGEWLLVGLIVNIPTILE